MPRSLRNPFPGLGFSMRMHGKSCTGQSDTFLSSPVSSYSCHCDIPDKCVITQSSLPTYPAWYTPPKNRNITQLRDRTATHPCQHRGINTGCQLLS